MRQADELSMTSTPAAAKRSACTFDIVAPAEKIATSRPDGSAIVGILDRRSARPSRAAWCRRCAPRRSSGSRRRGSRAPRAGGARRHRPGRSRPQHRCGCRWSCGRFSHGVIRHRHHRRAPNNLAIVQTPGARVDDGVDLAVEAERGVHRRAPPRSRCRRGSPREMRISEVGDHLDVDARLEQGGEQPGRDARRWCACRRRRPRACRSGRRAAGRRTRRSPFAASSAASTLARRPTCRA